MLNIPRSRSNSFYCQNLDILDVALHSEIEFVFEFWIFCFLSFGVVLTKSRPDKNGTTSNQTTTDCLSALAGNVSILTSFESSEGFKIYSTK
jgi:hypothetical protein